MLTIRLSRIGKKHDPSFRVVSVDSRRSCKSGNFIEILGSYNAQDKAKTALKEDRIKELIKQGAQLSATVNNLLVGKKIVAGKKRKNSPAFVKKIEEVKKEEVKKEEVKKEEAPKEKEEVKDVVVETKEEVKAEEKIEEKPEEKTE